MAKRGINKTNNLGVELDESTVRRNAVSEVKVIADRLSNAINAAEKTGMSFDDVVAQLTPDQKAIFEKEVKSGAQTIHLPLGRDFRMIPFELHEIPPDEIEEKTCLHAANIRVLKYFSDFDKQKCKEMLKLTDPNGKENKEVYVNTTPTLATWDKKKEQFAIFDGLRRRFGAMGQCPLKVYVTKESITHFHAQLASDKNNDHLTNGFLDRREMYISKVNSLQHQQQLSSEPELSERALAKKLGIHKMLLSAYLKSKAIPDELLIALPSPTTLGRPLISKLIPLFGEGGELNDGKLLAKCITVLKEFNKSLDLNTNPDTANKKAIEKLFKVVTESRPKDEDSTDSSIPYDYGSISRSSKTNEVNITINDLNTTSVKELMKALQGMLSSDS
ncbi:hypothetical protein [Vibrio coralliilyticus]|uniref:hypothetical protein n=1 Tax=Vibrio coralliilyticus TaxID=190893 RepID=UPI001E2DAA55|nr:hypothetical protein [Vibrio coralliilyticus]MCC2525027.1 hypothetical protein [Vibrio coralliilyticus]